MKPLRTSLNYMEDISLIYDDVSNDIWADEIRHIKIRELEELIDKESKMHNDVSELQRKLMVLIK